MENTYNKREGVSASRGHGRTAWYADYPQDDELALGFTEALETNGCLITLKVKGAPIGTHYVNTTFKFNLRDINPQSIKITSYSNGGVGYACESYDYQMKRLSDPPGSVTGKILGQCEQAQITFSTHNEAPLVNEEDVHIFPELQGSSHESKAVVKGTGAGIFVDNLEYGGRLAKAFRNAVELCGGVPQSF